MAPEDSKTITKSERRSGKLLGAAVQGVLAVVLIAAGWLLHSLMPLSPPMGPPGGPGGPGGPPAVVVEPVGNGIPEITSEYVGHVEPIQSVDIWAQVAGYLDTVHFEEGGVVEEGDLLFTIEPRPFEARVALSEAGLAQARASLPAAKAGLDASKANYERADVFLKRLQNADERGVVKADMDAATADYLQAKARVQQAGAAVQQAEAAIQQAEAALDLARIDLQFTRIRSPIAGRIGKAMATKGDYVSPAGGSLGHVVQVDPIRVVFSMTDREYVETLGKGTEDGPPTFRMQLRLPNGALFEELGKAGFNDNQMNPQTGTIAVRAQFSNAKGLLVPLSYVTVLKERTDVQPLPFVPQAAVMTDRQGQFVFIVDREGTAQERRIVAGPVVAGAQYIESGLSAGEHVIVQGTQKAQPGKRVDAALRQIPSVGA